MKGSKHNEEIKEEEGDENETDKTEGNLASAAAATQSTDDKACDQLAKEFEALKLR